MSDVIFNIQNFYFQHQLITMVVLMVLSLLPILFFARRFLVSALSKTTKIQEEECHNIIERHSFGARIIHFIVGLYLIQFIFILNESKVITDNFISRLDLIIQIYLIICCTAFIISILNIAIDVYHKKRLYKRMPISLYVQILEIICIFSAIIMIISLMLGISPSYVMKSIGATAAILTFIFKDVAIGLVMSLQMTLQDIIRLGDWITVPSYKADGVIEKITITVILVRNFDKSYSSIPTASLLNITFKNWRGMEESGGRRIKRALTIDLFSVITYNENELNNLKNQDFIKSLAIEQSHLFDIANKSSNLCLYRSYIEHYLKHHENIHHENFALTIRHLEPTANGMPLEIYVFTKHTEWPLHEKVQSTIFEHMIAVMPHFMLRPYQSQSYKPPIKND